MYHIKIQIGAFLWTAELKKTVLIQYILRNIHLISTKEGSKVDTVANEWIRHKEYYYK